MLVPTEVGLNSADMYEEFSENAPTASESRAVWPGGLVVFATMFCEQHASAVMV